MRVLVTGGGGFIGSHIVLKLLERGHAVRVAGRRRHPFLEEKGADSVVGDLAEREAAFRAAEGCEAVIHAAAAPGIAVGEQASRRSNVLATLNILEAARALGVRRFVHTSTPSVVHGGDSIEGGDESLPYPRTFLTAYARTKAEAEKAALAANSREFAVCAIRPHLVFGPGDAQLIPKILARARSGRLARIGGGKNRVSVSYVENVADAHCLALDALGPGSRAAGQAYFINEPEPVNCWDFINRIVTGAGLPGIVKSVPFRPAYAAGWFFEKFYALAGMKSDPPMTRFLATQLATSHWFKVDKARRDLGWEPKVSLDEGVRRLLDSLLARKISIED